MQKTCTQCSASFEVTDKDLVLYDKVSPTFQGKKYAVPPPSLCANCRQQRRLSRRNEWSLYRDTCDLTGKDIVSLYAPESPYTVYDQDVWWSDQFDPLEYGRDFDFSRSFFDQYHELELAVPRQAIQNAKSENCAYTNYSTENKNCYYLVGGLGSEDCYYSYRIFYANNIIDSYDLYKCELCYECIDSKDLFNCTFCQNCTESSDLTLCAYCIGCQSCFGCTNLRNKQYHIFNKPYDKASYLQTVKELLGDFKSATKKFMDLKQALPHKALDIINTENCTGDNILNCKNCHQVFTLKNSEDCHYIWNGEGSNDCIDANFADNCELQCNCTSLEKNHSVLCGNYVWYTKNSCYVSTCFHSSNLFGCIGMKKHEYCVLNKQYTKEEYELLVPKIIEHMQETGEWGVFPPASHSPFAYNETLAQDYFPLTETEVKARGWRWREKVDDMPTVEKVIPANKLPESIDQIPDDILNWAIVCEETKRPFKIIKQELEFYRQIRLPIPHFHPDERHKRRMALRNPRRLWERKCDKCSKNIQTTYSPERKETVYCEECYLAEVY